MFEASRSKALNQLDNFIENQSVIYVSKGAAINQKLIKYHYYNRTFKSVTSDSDSKITEKIRTSKSLQIKSDSELNLLFIIW